MKTQIVLLAAGKSSRFFPFNDTHKSMFSVCGKPIIGWALDGLKKLGISKVLVVVSKDDKNIQNYLKNYRGINLTIVYQEKPLGMGDALLSARDKLNQEFIVGFPHFVNPKVIKMIAEKRDPTSVASLLVDKTDEPWKYGILTLEGKKAVGIVEKPPKGKEPSKIRASGIYFLNKNFIRTLESTPKEEYNFERALDGFMKEEEVEVVILEDGIFPLKYPWDIFKIRDYILENMPETRAKNAQISSTATLRGKVILEEGSKVFDYALVEGPAYLGKGAVVGAYCQVRGGSVIECGAELQRYVDFKNSFIGNSSSIHSGFVGDSIIGSNVEVGAGFISANKRIDREIICSMVNKKRVDTNLRGLGVIIGNNARLGIRVSTMPGAIIGPGSTVYPNVIVRRLIDAGEVVRSKWYDKKG